MDFRLVALITVLSVTVVSGNGYNLKTIFSMFNAKCDDGQASCKSADGLTCCSFPLGVCCDGGKACCPLGFTCDQDSCVSKYGKAEAQPTTPHYLQKKVDYNLPLQFEPKSINSTCKTKTCNGDQTCCHDDWDCCPVPEAVCCKDKGHCCPHGYICDDQPMICRWPDDKHIVKTVEYAEKTSLATVQCDESHECPDGNTCCKMADGDWGCCPVTDATCCDDHIHCCAKGTTCDTAHGKCNSKSGLQSVSWVTKTRAKKIPVVADVQCDSSHYCPNGNTCCKLASGQWGCCPVPNAVCCSDRTHCCPSGYTCQTGSGECTKGLESIPWLTKEAPIEKHVENVQCDATHQCPDGNTCCKLASGQWGCCPVPNAVCCSDHTHCCPSGYTCQTGTGECTRGLESIPWLTKEAPIEKQVENVQCDATHQCPDGNTCCKLASGQWGCCPVPNAVCCSDHTHCCPSGYTCQTGTGECTRGIESIPWLTKEAPIEKHVENVQCDATHQCPDGNTCCKLASGQWGCCPVPNAVCCSDHTHCCPSGYTCQTGTGECTRGLESIPWLTKEAPIEKQVENVQCDATHQCPDGNTCCKLASGQWGCCPVPNAVCCSDHTHCCPSGYTCQTGTGECTRGLESIPWLTKEAPIEKHVENVQCDATHQCPDGNTCCKLASGQWGCCPVPYAVCCSDHTHCCPSGYTCQTGTGECTRGLESIPWLSKEAPIKKAVETVENVQCDATHFCPSGNTCCKLASGQWGCCPVPNAVCCSDQTHCCPSGYTCQTGTGECTRGLESIPWLSKEAPIKKAVETVENVQCDATHFCPSGNTCCKLASGQWGCCPVPNAVCCSDQTHCCPSGYTCQTGTGECTRGLESIPWLSKEAPIEKAVENVQCDATHFCPSGNTCCRLASGQWGCCPVPNAVCCSDHTHCCPSGYTCQTGTGECTRGIESIPWLSKEAPIEKAVEAVENVQCDATHFCPSGNTCCRLASGQWGCCPVPNAVCCSDHTHCCPSGYTCQTGTGECTRGIESIPWLTKEAPIEKHVENVQCDATHQCPDGNTCCKLASGQWGCCPVPNAVCCSDQTHCCPSGYTCQTGTGECTRGLESIPWLSKEAPIEKAVETVENVQCDATHFCPSGNTCCKLASGQWGCCPVPNAVCCSDQTHCCPSGYTCQTGTGECTRGIESIPWLTKEAPIEKHVENVQCDATHQCPDGNTCCKLASGQWGCCPVPNAVCCSDQTHCCPSGYTCQTGTGECTRGIESIPWLTKEAPIEKAVENVQCDATHFCPSGNTCCKLASGQWGCCPVPNAVCCSDQTHCCPSGYTCQTGTGECTRGLESIPWLSKEAPIEKAVETVENVQCDATHFCPSGNTCCKLASGQWGCCPVPNAVCCSDQTHCCPSGYTCQTGTGECTRGIESIPWLTKEAPIEKAVENVQCDATHFCPSGNTCCKLASGQWGCCPVPNAVCCSDQTHCCPSGYTCQTGTGECTRGLESIPWLSKEAPIEKAVEAVENVQCDATHFCPSGNTCCRLASGQWGCCPVPNAVCCSDHTNCCPSGYTCQTGTGECTRGIESIPWLTKEAPIEKHVENVQCDATHQCPDGNTCCKLASGQWGCCPVPNAVCCSDQTHCCPSGYTCQTGTGECTRGLESIPWLSKEAPIEKAVETVENVQCDATHFCPSGNTCCKLASGQWGCCPVPNAVCCSDQTHCCPSGYTCQTGTGECTRGIESIPWLTKEAPIEKHVENVQCDATHQCPDGNTCCKLASGQWGCCPVPNAVCCSDQTHCCPSGYTCQTGTGECTRGIESIPWLTKEAPIEKAVENVQCDATHFCPSGNTCCKLASGQWGCCPVPNAVCCSDQTHCCPSGYTCQTGTGECTRGLESIPWLSKEAPIEKAVETVENVQCDATHFCPSGNTCCKLASGQWGCCPVPNAVCCSDQTHCCPSGYTCQTGTGECTRGIESIPWLTKEAPIEKAVENVQCDATHFCPSGNTCCKLASGQWGCCPVPNAVCCSDQTHCCPSGYTCQTGTGECTRGLESIPWLSKEAPIEKAVEAVENVQCDATHFCPSGNTCCRLASGQWGCCPVPNAVCCSDHTHCCPSGYTCQTGTGECTRGIESIPWLSKEAPIEKHVENVQCDATHQCPDGNTCCKLASGQWGCCPVPNAVCCSDQTHCCPSGYTCQTGTGECTRGLESIPWLSKEAPIEKAVETVENVQCDATHFCPSGNTCCKLASGQWGCCPVPNAVCCSDQTHCCPSGYTCQTGTGECTRGLESIPWLSKEAPIEKAVENVQCDATHFCPSGNTCCRLASGQWGCCPVPNAVCCSDHTHCCPSGYTCQTGTGECTRGLESIPWLSKEAPIEKAVENVQCDATHYCPSGNTCCKLASGQWGCCPVPNAVCCSDHTHCCPSGYTCQSGTGECARGEEIISWLTKEAAKPVAESQPSNVVKSEYVRCDDQFECPDGYTCCMMEDERWGCCPYPDAVCCSDGEHCCPSGYTCDPSDLKCTNRNFERTAYHTLISALNRNR